MTQLALFETKFWSITELTRHIRGLFESDEDLQDLWVQGEISNFRRPSSGHLYFTLKDTTCAIRCVMWRTTAARLKFSPRDGDAVEVHGSISVYEADGQYQIYADVIRPTGEGKLYREFLRLKSQLESEGLFAPERKREIPHWPQRIGVVTSPTGAALRDMIHTMRRRYPLVQLILSPTAVQGLEAPQGVVNAIDALCRLSPAPDVIIVARGGGSIEDLWAFNDERVARAIAGCPVPVISGVGHETDFTIADFVSDLRAATPTAAAELATPNREDLEIDRDELIRRSLRAVGSMIVERRWEFQRLESRLAGCSPQGQIRSGRQRVDDLARRAETTLRHRVTLQGVRIQGLEYRLAALNPLAVLRRGYAIVSRPSGPIVRSRQQVSTGDLLEVRVVDGTFGVQVTEASQPDIDEE